MAQSEDLGGQLAARSEARQGRENQGAEEVRHLWAAWFGRRQTSTISRQTAFSGPYQLAQAVAAPPDSRVV